MAEKAEILFAFGKSKEVLRVDLAALETCVKSRLPSGSKSSPCLIPFDDCPPVKGNFILQKWSERWKTYVNCGKEIKDGDRLTVVECDCEASGVASLRV